MLSISRRTKTLTLAVVGLLSIWNSASAASLPIGFIESLVANGLDRPTAMEFTPDGRLFVSEQGGQLRVIKNGVLLATPFLSANVNDDGERGLLGIAFDPGFATNHFVYVYYTAPTPAVHNRVSRFTANGDIAVVGSEVVILDLDNLGDAPFHNGGGLHFGSDGKLYITTGENANDANAQTLTNLLGKLLRVNADGTIPTDNPFYNIASGVNRAIFALGLRNPFTFAVQPGTGRIFINDVGENTWEEINEAIPGANYGWPACEGDCNPTNSSYRDPFFRYSHSDGSAIAGGAFYDPPTSQFPATNAGAYFFADYVEGWIWKLDPTNGNQVTEFATGINAPVDLKVGPDGRLYYLARDSSAIYAVSYTGSSVPQITQQPVDQFVHESEPVTFTVASIGALGRQWRRNGTNVSGANAASFNLPAVSVADDGAVFRCVLTNTYGAVTSSPAVLHVSTNKLPAGTISSPLPATLYSAGDTIQYSGAATDPEDGTLPASAFSWTVVFHHNTHTHPFLGPIASVTNGSFVIPTDGETSPNVWYRIHLAVTDSVSQTHTSFVDVTPRTANMSLATSPAGLQLTLDGQPVTTPASVTGVVGMHRTLGVISPQVSGGATYAFASWSDGGPATHDISTPPADTNYTATFVQVNGSPGITSTADQTINMNSSTGPLGFTVGDTETPANSLTLSKGSSNPTLVPTNSIVFGGSGSNRTVTVTPETSRTGTATITVTVSDGTNETSTGFLLTVINTNSAPRNLAAAAISQTQINLSWTAPAETPGVAQYLIERCQGSNCNGFVQIASLSVTGAMGPLAISAPNPRYFATPNGKAVLLGGSHHWINFIDSGTVYPPPAFDYDAWLDFLSTNHHNFFRLWAQGLPKKNYGLQDAGPWYQSPQAWLRTGPGNATDGLPKFDLTQFNQAYFDRLRLRVEKAKARGMYVSIMLFDGFHIQFDRRTDDGFPLSGANNINGVDDGGGTRSQDFSVIPSAVLAAEEDYVRKVIDTVNDLPNVLYEIANEAGDYSTAWQQHFIAFVKNYEAGKPSRHPVGFTYQYSGGSDATLYASAADWVSPADSEASNDGTRHVILNDTDHSYFWVDLKASGAQANRAFVWRNFTSGNSALFMDPYLMPWTWNGNTRNTPTGCVSGPSCTVVDPFWNPIRQNIGYMLDYANGKLDLAKMTPQSNLSSVGRCLANAAVTDAEYLIYTGSGTSFTVNLSATTRPLAVEWLNPTTGAITSGGTIAGGSSAQSFTPPFSGDAVLYLSDTAGRVSQTAYNDIGLMPNTTYRYRVRVFDTEGNFSPYSDVASATTPPTNTPSTSPSFTNATAITVPSQGAVTPYPSTINVSGMLGTISNVTVTLRGLTHTWASDLDVLLVGPGGQKMVLMSDAGSGGANDVTVTLSDTAAAALPSSGLVSGTFHPTNYVDSSGGGDNYPSPAPAGPYGATLSTFNGTNPNGTWSLYVFDDGPGDSGSIAGGWSLTITNMGPKELTVTGITADNKIYDGTNTATIHIGSAVLVGVTGGDNVTLVTAGATGTFDNKNAGSGKTVQVAGLTLTGPDAYKYSLTQPTTTANITTASLTVTALNANKVYGTSLGLSGTAFTRSGTLYGDDSLTKVSLSSPGAPATATVGSYAIVPSAAEGEGLANYGIGYSNGTLTITAHTLNVVANNATRLYQHANPVFTGTLIGVQNGDNITASYSSAATSDSVPGEYAIVPTLIDPGGKLVNYTVAATNGVLTIINAPLFLSISESAQGSFVVECQVHPGRTYRFQFKNSLSETNWTSFGADQTAVSSRVAITNNADTNLQRFYRLLDVTPP